MRDASERAVGDRRRGMSASENGMSVDPPAVWLQERHRGSLGRHCRVGDLDCADGSLHPTSPRRTWRCTFRDACDRSRQRIASAGEVALRTVRL